MSVGQLACRLRSRRGVETIEALFCIGLIIVITSWAALVTFIFGNALVAQHALSQTALYVASAGRWTPEMRDFCQSLTPQPAGQSGSCQVVLVTADGTEVPLGFAAENGALRPDDIAPYNSVLRIYVRYNQPFFQVCLFSDACVGRQTFAITRRIEVRSQTQSQAVVR